MEKCKKQKTSVKFTEAFTVDLPGFEPRQTVPKTVVLPLHNRSIII